jgi:hypothetical protein
VRERNLHRLQEEYLCGTNASKVREKTEAGKMMYDKRNVT